jgi:hypothetical protein
LSPEPGRKLLDAAIVLLAAVLLLIIALGGIDYDWGILRIRLHSLSRPLLLLCAALGLRAWLAAVDASYIATRGMLALLLAAAAIYATYQVRVCGGLDSYGYVSTSALIAEGRLTQPQPLAAYLPFDSASSAVAPLGYVAGPGGHTEVPRFSLGLPILMAGFRIFGPMGPFYVPLLMAYVTMVLAFLIANDALNAGRTVSCAMVFPLLAAVLVAVDPLMVDYGMQPMSDIPAACWLLAAVWLRGIVHRPSSIVHRPSSIVSDGRWTSVLAGVCAGMALLTRSALLPAVVAVGLVWLDRPVKETIRYAATLLVFVVLQMAINMTLYGGAFKSGYGPASYMFELSSNRLGANLANFGKWLTFSHTFVIWLLWPASMLILRNRKWAWQISAVAAAAAAPYLFYLVFDDWESSRFVLPAILLVLILAATALGELLARFRSPLVPTFALVLAVVCAAASHRFLQRQDVYRLWDFEAKYALVGEWIDLHLPPKAVVFAGQHSGSIRYYGHRQTIRWDQIPEDKMSATLHNLQAAGYEPYLALDVASEPPRFESRFRQDPAVRTEQIGRIRVVNFYRFVSAP